jgi:hypothetical protein
MPLLYATYKRILSPICVLVSDKVCPSLLRDDVSADQREESANHEANLGA